MKARIFICALLIPIVSLISSIPAWGQQARAYASILIIIPPAQDEVKNEIKEESTALNEKEQPILAKANTDLAEEEE